MKLWILFYVVLFTVELYDSSPLTKRRSGDYNDVLEVESLIKAIALQESRNGHPKIGPLIKASDNPLITEKKQHIPVTVTNNPSLLNSNIGMGISKAKVQIGKASDSHNVPSSTSSEKKDHILSTVTSRPSLMMSSTKTEVSKEKEQFGKATNSPVVATSTFMERKQHILDTVTNDASSLNSNIKVDISKIIENYGRKSDSPGVATSAFTEKKQLVHVTATDYPSLLSSSSKMDISKANVQFRKASDNHMDATTTSTEKKERIPVTDISHPSLGIVNSKTDVTKEKAQSGKTTVATSTVTEKKLNVTDTNTHHASLLSLDSKMDISKPNVEFRQTSDSHMDAPSTSTDKKEHSLATVTNHPSLVARTSKAGVSKEKSQLEKRSKSLVVTTSASTEKKLYIHDTVKHHASLSSSNSKMSISKENVQFGKANISPVVITSKSTEWKDHVPDITTSQLSSNSTMNSSNEIIHLKKKGIALKATHSDPNIKLPKVASNSEDLDYHIVLVLVPKEKNPTANSKEKEIENKGPKDMVTKSEAITRDPEKSTQQLGHANGNILRNENVDMESSTVSKDSAEPLVKHLYGEKTTEIFEEKSKNTQHMNLGSKVVTASSKADSSSKKENILRSDELVVTPEKAKQFQNDKTVAELPQLTHHTNEAKVHLQKFAYPISYQSSPRNDKINAHVNKENTTVPTKAKGKQEQTLISGQTEKIPKQN